MNSNRWASSRLRLPLAGIHKVVLMCGQLHPPTTIDADIIPRFSVGKTHRQGRLQDAGNRLVFSDGDAWVSMWQPGMNQNEPGLTPMHGKAWQLCWGLDKMPPGYHANGSFCQGNVWCTKLWYLNGGDSWCSEEFGRVPDEVVLGTSEWGRKLKPRSPVRVRTGPWARSDRCMRNS